MSEEEIGVGVGFMPESVSTRASHRQMGWPDTCATSAGAPQMKGGRQIKGLPAPRERYSVELPRE